MRRVAVARVAYAFAVALWAGGKATLGAVVAPVVFRVVAAPASADAMTRVFRRFDRVALACALVAVLSEGVLLFSSRVNRRGRARAGLLAAATGLASVGAAFLSPGIEALHRAGAIRGLGADGLALERLHAWAERLAKAELLLLVGVLSLIVLQGTPVAVSGSRLAKEADRRDPVRDPT